ncbi:MAG: hypothetical protein AB8B85_16985 [Paracoccaceae bacterium]
MHDARDRIGQLIAPVMMQSDLEAVWKSLRQNGKVLRQVVTIPRIRAVRPNSQCHFVRFLTILVYTSTIRLAH